MRNPNRLDKIYEQMLADHKKYLPDWRVCQLMSNFLGEVYADTGRDPFFMEDAEMLAQWNKFIDKLTGRNN